MACKAKNSEHFTRISSLILFVFTCKGVHMMAWSLNFFLLAHWAKPELRKVPRAIFFLFRKWHSCLWVCIDHLFCLLLLAHAGCQPAWAESNRQNRWSKQRLLPACFECCFDKRRAQNTALHSFLLPKQTLTRNLFSEYLCLHVKVCSRNPPWLES